MSKKVTKKDIFLMRLALTLILHVKITFAETEIFCPITLSYSSQNLSMFPCAHLSYTRNLYSHATEKTKKHSPL